MAKLIKNRDPISIDRYLDDLLNGNYNNSSVDYGLNPHDGIAKKLDALRLQLLDKQSNDAKSRQDSAELIGNIVHDLKTPLALIAGYAESLSDGMSDKDYAQLIQQRVKDMDATVIGIITSTKTDVSQLQNERVRVSLRNYLPSTLDKALFVASQKGIKCTIGKLPAKEVFISTQAFDSLFNNLISNATKHTPQNGKISIKFTVRGSRLTIAVRDNGSGIKPEDIPHVFDLYYTEDKARTNGGTGIGLAQVKRTIEAHGGQVYVKSRLGKGSTFYITIECFDEKAQNKTEGNCEMRRCSKWAAFWLCLFFGIFGQHYLYEGKFDKAILYACTIGFFGIGWLVDVVRYLFKPNPYYIAVK